MVIDLGPAITQCAAAELALRRLLAERAAEPEQELQGELSFSEERLARQLACKEAA